jgi:hypothetical protein
MIGSNKIDNTPRIGFRLSVKREEGVVLQTCKVLPKHHNREDEIGYFYGVKWEDKYVWYNYQQIIDLIKEE